jgi:hypothetical protein
MSYPQFHHLGFKCISFIFMMQCISYMNVNLKFKLENQKKLDEIKTLLQARNRLQ